jgi:glutamate-1-semialdehyde 2,1-aminomutase
MKKINGVPMIGLLLNRLSMVSYLDQIMLATPSSPNSLPLDNYVTKLGYEVFKGSEDDVLDRYYQAAKQKEPDAIIRITGDCPLIDPELVSDIINCFIEQDIDYLSNTLVPTYPDGLDTEIFTFKSLEKAAKLAKKPSEREHVTPFIYESGLFKTENYNCDEDHSNKRWTVDEAVDFEVISSVYDYFSPNIEFNWRDVLSLQEKKPELFKINQHLIRNEGISMGIGQKLWKRAKEIIPGGNMLLSKRPEMFLPEQWPAYYSRAEGCKVWDLDDNEYIDMSFMGIGTNILGYGNHEINDAVHKSVNAGNMSTLNCPEEVYLAEKLIELHPWADMVRLARAGGEANAIAIRIARAASGKDKIAFCGYHGWHDWYLAANLKDDKNLEGHLLSGLEPIGVPQNLQDTIFPFRYNDFDELNSLVQNHEIGIIKMEVFRNQLPKDNFLEKVRQLATDKNIVLIFDECTSGFRQTFGGLHKLYDVEPDIAVFGKALGNGYAITAIIGRREVMENAQSSFISSTFWTERIGPTAALKTLEVMERLKSWELITETGEKITQRWKALAERYGLKITTSGMPALTSFSIDSPNMLEYRTLITQEMMYKGFIAGTSVYVCIDHTDQIIENYLVELEPIFKLIKDCEDGLDVKSLLKGPVCHDGFKRLN